MLRHLDETAAADRIDRALESVYRERKTLTRDVGGVADVVHDGANGIVLPENADASQFAAEIEALWNDPKRYEELRASARREYEARLNWDVWASKIAELVNRLEAEGRI